MGPVADGAIDAGPIDGVQLDDGLVDLSPPDQRPVDAAIDVARDAGVDTTPFNPPLPNGTGLLGEYFDGTMLEAGTPGTLEEERVDVIDFDWGTGRPFPNMDLDYFSVRWTGEIMPLHSETYSFSTSTDDGVRLWVNGVKLFDTFTTNRTPGGRTQSATIPLVARQRYSIRMDYYETLDRAMARLYWSSPSQPMQIVPRMCLFPPPP